MIKTKMLAILMVSLMMAVTVVPLTEGEDVSADTETADPQWLYGIGYNNVGQIGIENHKTISTPTQIGAGLGTITKVQQVSYNSSFATMVLTSNGKLYAIGYDSSGQFGTGSATTFTEFTQIGSTLGTITDFVLTERNTYVLTSDGKLYGCGGNGRGQLGTGAAGNTLLTFTQIGSTLGTITKVWSYKYSSYDINTFFMTQDGKLYGLGSNTNNIISETTGNVTTPTQIGAGLGTISDLYYSSADGGQGACLFIMTTSGDTYAVGYNSQGMLAVGTNTSPITTLTQITSSIGTITKIRVTNKSGASATNFLTSDGKIYGAGHSTYSGMGSSSGNQYDPRQVGSSLNVTFADFENVQGTTVAITTDNLLYGWGSNTNGQLGNNVQNPTWATSQQTPIQMASDLNVSKYYNLPSRVYIITSDGKLYGAGSNYEKNIDPTNNSESITVFTQIGSTLGTITDVVSDFVFKTSNGNYYGSGSNGYNQYGFTLTSYTNEFVQIYSGMNLVNVDRIGLNTFAYTTDGLVYTMGYNNYYVPKVSSVTEYTQISNDINDVLKVIDVIGATYFLTSDGKLYGMGGNYSGNLGSGGTKESSVPIQIGAGLGTIVDFASTSISLQNDLAYYGTTYFVTSDGKLYGTGYSAYGQLGSTVTSYTPVQIGAELGTITKVFAGNSWGVFLTSDGKLYGMGQNTNGQLGTGDTNNVITPTQIGAELGTIVDVYARYSTLLFLTSDGKLYGCGYNGNGQLGTGDTNNVTTPTQIGAGLGTIAKAKVFNNNNYFITSDGKLYGMGQNSSKVITSTTINNVTTPTQIGAELGRIVDVGLNPSYGTTMLTSNNEIYEFRNSLSQKDMNIGTIDKLVANGSTTFLITTNGKLYGYGVNYINQIESSSTSTITNVTRIGTSNNVIDIVYGENTGNYSHSTVFYIAGPQRAEITVASNDDNYGTVSPSTLMVDPGNTITISGNTITYGSDTITATSTEQTTTSVYNFNGWYNGATLIEDGTLTITEDMTITANFSENVRLYDVTVTSSNTDYGTVSSALVQVPYNTTIASATNTITLGTTPDATVVTATPTTSDAQYTYAFSDWTGVPVSGYITEATDITASFTQTLNTYTITWVVGDSSTTETYDYGATPTHENPTPPEGYYFAGWNPEIATVTGDQTYTAVFSNMTVTFDAGKGTLDGGASKVVVIGQPIGELPECTPPTNYTFDGWYTAATGGTKVTEDTIVTQEASFTLYAHYELVPALQPVKAILDILPILMAVGLILGAVYVFITRPELATSNNLLYAIVGISVAVLMMAVFVIPIIGSAL